jgi:hypothetical protein
MKSLNDTTNKTTKKKADVCREFDLENSTIQTIWQNITKIISALDRTD